LNVEKENVESLLLKTIALLDNGRTEKAFGGSLQEKNLCVEIYVQNEITSKRLFA